MKKKEIIDYLRKFDELVQNEAAHEIDNYVRNYFGGSGTNSPEYFNRMLNLMEEAALKKNEVINEVIEMIEDYIKD